MVVKVSELFGKNSVYHKHTLELLLYCALYSSEPLDTSDVIWDLDLMDATTCQQIQGLIDRGKIITEQVFSTSPTTVPDDSKLIESSINKEGTVWGWSVPDLIDRDYNLGKKFSNASQRYLYLIKVAAYWLVNNPSPDSVLILDTRDKSFPTAYNPICLLCKTVTNLYRVQVQLSKSDGDWDSHVYFSQVTNNFREYNPQEKFMILKEHFNIGSLYILISRKFDLNSTNPNHIGVVPSDGGMSLVRLDGYDSKVHLTVLMGNYTFAEDLMVFRGLPPDAQKRFSDMQVNSPKETRPLDLSLYDIGMDLHFYQESHIITHLDSASFNPVHLSDSRGTIFEATISDVELAYWLAREGGVEIAKELFRQEYNEGNPMIYDRVESGELIVK